MTPQPKPPLLLLVSGYTGQGRSADATSHDPDRQLVDISPTQRVRFDLAQPDMWVDIPMGADIIWCFPATPLEHVQVFAGTLSASSERLESLQHDGTGRERPLRAVVQDRTDSATIRATLRDGSPRASHSRMRQQREGLCGTVDLAPWHGCLQQDAEQVRQLCSRVAQRLDVPQGYASPPRSLRPRWTAFLSILQAHQPSSRTFPSPNPTRADAVPLQPTKPNRF